MHTYIDQRFFSVNNPMKYQRECLFGVHTQTDTERHTETTAKTARDGRIEWGLCDSQLAPGFPIDLQQALECQTLAEHRLSVCSYAMLTRVRLRTECCAPSAVHSLFPMPDPKGHALCWRVSYGLSAALNIRHNRMQERALKRH